MIKKVLWSFFWFGAGWMFSIYLDTTYENHRI